MCLEEARTPVDGQADGQAAGGRKAAGWWESQQRPCPEPLRGRVGHVAGCSDSLCCTSLRKQSGRPSTLGKPHAHFARTSKPKAYGSLWARLQSSQLAIKNMSLPRLCVPCRVILGRIPLCSLGRAPRPHGLVCARLSCGAVTASVPVSSQQRENINFRQAMTDLVACDPASTGSATTR